MCEWLCIIGWLVNMGATNEKYIKLMPKSVPLMSSVSPARQVLSTVLLYAFKTSVP